MKNNCQTILLSMFVFLSFSGAALHAQAPGCGTIFTIAGNSSPPGQIGFSGDGGPATNAALFSPRGSAIGPDGSIYFSDQGNFRIRRIAPDGVITTVAATALIVILTRRATTVAATVGPPQTLRLLTSRASR